VKKTMKKLIIPVMVLLFATVGMADTNSTCVSNTLSQLNVTFQLNDNWYNTTENIVCKFGCNNETGDCYDVGTMDIPIVIGIPIVAMVIAYLGINFKKDDWPMQMLLLAISFALLLMNVGIMQRTAEITGSYSGGMLLGGLQAVSYTFLLVLLYYILKVIVTAYRMLGVSK